MGGRSAAYVQAIRGPILLMTIGTLFAVQQSGGAGFWQTWPLLLIAIGVMLLIERMVGGSATAAGAAQQPYGAQQTGSGQQYWPRPGQSWSGQAGPGRTGFGQAASPTPGSARPMPGAQATAQAPPPPLPPQTGGPQS